MYLISSCIQLIKRYSSILVWRGGVSNNPYRKKIGILQNIKQSLGLKRFESQWPFCQKRPSLFIVKIKLSFCTKYVSAVVYVLISLSS
jgi:hypothetical protein